MSQFSVRGKGQPHYDRKPVVDFLWIFTFYRHFQNGVFQDCFEIAQGFKAPQLVGIASVHLKIHPRTGQEGFEILDILYRLDRRVLYQLF